LPQYIARKNSWCLTPLQFMTALTTLFIILAILLPDPPPDLAANKAELVINMLTDSGIVLLALPILCLLIWLITFFRSLYRFVSPSLRLHLLLPLSPWTYARLDLGRFARSMAYYGLYFLLVSPLWMVLVIVAGNALYFAFVQTSLFHTLILTGLCGVVAGVGYWLIVRPYLAILRASIVVPTKLMIRTDCRDIEKLITDIGQSDSLDIAREHRWTISKKVATLERQWALQDRQALAQSGEALELLRSERRRVLARMFSADRLRSLLDSDVVTDGLRHDVQQLVDKLTQTEPCPTALPAS
jgi:hypothetical protein